MSKPVPLLLSIPIAGGLIGLGRVSSYRHALQGGFPLADMPGRKKVITSEFEKMIGTTITPERYEAAVKAARVSVPASREAVAA